MQSFECSISHRAGRTEGRSSPIALDRQAPAGLRLLKEREKLKQLRLAELRKEIAIGSAKADRGEFVDGEETFAAIRKRSAERKFNRLLAGSQAASDRPCASCCA